MSLKSAQEAVREISGDFHKRTVWTSSFFFALLMEQVGQCAINYMHKGRAATRMDEDVADIVIACLCYLNWLDEDADRAFRKALKKHRRNIELLSMTLGGEGKKS